MIRKEIKKRHENRREGKKTENKSEDKKKKELGEISREENWKQKKARRKKLIKIG